MSVVFKAHLNVDFTLTRCPEEGLSALDWRREHGFGDNLTNKYNVTIDRAVTEEVARKLLAHGWMLRVGNGGLTGVIDDSPLPLEFDPERGYIAIDLERPADDVDLLCLAHTLRAVEAEKAALKAKCCAACGNETYDGACGACVPR